MIPCDDKVSKKSLVIDTKEFNSFSILLSIQKLNTDIQIYIEESNTGYDDDFYQVSQEDLYGQRSIFKPDEDDDRIYRYGYHGKFRFIRVRVLGDGKFAVNGLLSHANDNPATTTFITYGNVPPKEDT